MSMAKHLVCLVRNNIHDAAKIANGRFHDLSSFEMRKHCYAALVMVLVLAIHLLIMSWINVNTRTNITPTPSLNEEKFSEPPKSIDMKSKEFTQKRYSVVYYNPTRFITKNRKYAMKCDFKPCEWNNCDLILDKKDANRSDAVIFDGIFIPQHLDFNRPLGQIWVFAAHESPLKYNMGKDWWYRNEKYIFNWTITYNKNNSDIFLPYGELRKAKNITNIDFRSIALQKENKILMIASNCNTQSRRAEFVQKLRKYVPVDILGRCGRKWNCGIHFKHDEYCFEIINKYRFYLAFENALCHQYFSEKFFENYRYDSIMVTRGGSRGEASRLFPPGTHISTDNFKTIKELGLYLNNLPLDDYVKLLEQKNQYTSVTYDIVYQRSLCDLCKMMNFQDKYAKTIKSMKDWAFQNKPCITGKEVYDLH